MADDELLYTPDSTESDALRLHTGYYILDGTHEPVPVTDVLAWAHWHEMTDRRVALTAVTPTIEVSTVFLGLDHNFSGHGPPLLFETMVFQALSAPDQRHCLTSTPNGTRPGRTPRTATPPSVPWFAPP